MTKHTPTPWKIDQSSFQSLCGGIRIVQDKSGITQSSPVASVPIYEHDGTATATAEFIVLAVNNYDALLEAAKAAREWVHQDHIPVGKGICEWWLCKQLREAIAAVEGRTE